MRSQAHGGALKSGGRHANAGRPPSALRAIAREALADALPGLRLVAIGEPVKVTRVVSGETIELEMRAPIAERMEAFDRLYTTGMGEELRTEDVRKRLEATAQILADELAAAGVAPDVAQRIVAKVGEAWA
jgi:hypothetical protein